MRYPAHRLSSLYVTGCAPPLRSRPIPTSFCGITGRVSWATLSTPMTYGSRTGSSYVFSSSPRSSMPHPPGCLPSGDQQHGLRVKSLLSWSLLSFRVPQEVAAVDALCSLVGSACPKRGGAESGVRPDAAERRVPSSRVRHGPVHGDVLGEARVASPHRVSDPNQTANTGWRSHGPHVSQFTHPCFRT